MSNQLKFRPSQTYRDKYTQLNSSSFVDLEFRLLSHSAVLYNQSSFKCESIVGTQNILIKNTSLCHNWPHYVNIVECAIWLVLSLKITWNMLMRPYDSCKSSHGLIILCQVSKLSLPVITASIYKVKITFWYNKIFV